MSITKSIVQIGLAATCLAVASLGIGWGTAHAQLGGGGQGGGFGGGGGGGFGGGGGQGGFGGGGGGFQPGGPMMPAMGAPAPIVVEDGSYLYVLRGPQLLKVDKSDLSVRKVTELPPVGFPMGRRGGGQGFGGGPGFAPPPAPPGSGNRIGD